MIHLLRLLTGTLVISIIYVIVWATGIYRHILFPLVLVSMIVLIVYCLGYMIIKAVENMACKLTER